MIARLLGHVPMPWITPLRVSLVTFTFPVVSAAFAIGITDSFTSEVLAPDMSGEQTSSGGFAVASDPGLPLADPPPVTSRGRTNCGECVGFRTDKGDVHQAMEHLLPKSGWGPGKDEDPPWHPTTLEPGLCEWVHGFCIHAGGTAEAQTAGEVQAAIIAAAAVRDVEELARLADLAAVTVVPERTALQVIGCDGLTVVAHVPVDPAVLVDLQAVRADLDR